VDFHGIHLVADSKHRAGCQTRSIVRGSKVGRRGLEDAKACPDRRWTYVAQPAPGRVRDDDVKGCLNRAGSRVSLNVVETRRD